MLRAPPQGRMVENEYSPAPFCSHPSALFQKTLSMSNGTSIQCEIWAKLRLFSFLTAGPGKTGDRLVSCAPSLFNDNAHFQQGRPPQRNKIRRPTY